MFSMLSEPRFRLDVQSSGLAWAMHLELAMHVLSYEVKRLHWRATWFAIRIFREAGRHGRGPELIDMTPARFDVMHAIRTRKSWAKHVPGQPYAIGIAELVQKLGLSNATVSRMISRMVDIGWLTREVDGSDRRRGVVGLTALGVRTFELAARAVFDGGILTWPFENFVRAQRRWPALATAAAATVLIVARCCRALVLEFGDGSSPLYDPDWVDV